MKYKEKEVPTLEEDVGSDAVKNADKLLADVRYF